MKIRKNSISAINQNKTKTKSNKNDAELNMSPQFYQIYDLMRKM